MKKILTILCFGILINSSAQNQNAWIYGISDLGDFTHGYFTRMNYMTGEYDTLIDLGGVWIEEFSSCIDPYNGRYFLFGYLGTQYGNFHIIDLNDLSIESFDLLTAEKPEYNIFSNSVIHEDDSIFYSFNLGTHMLGQFPGTFNQWSTLWGKKRTYNAFNNTYVYCARITEDWDEPYYYIILDGFDGSVLTTASVPDYEGHALAPEGLVADFETGIMYAYHDEIVFRTDPYTGDYEILLTIPGYESHLNQQIATYDQLNKKYIIPFKSGNTYKIAIIDMINNEIDTIIFQPDRRMDEHQIYCMPETRLNFIKDTLFSTHGEKYSWFFDNIMLQEAAESYLIPLEQGDYQVLTDFTTYSSLSNIVPYYFAGSDYQTEDASVRIYPNPFSDKIKIEMTYNQVNHFKDEKISIYDIQGRKIMGQSLTGTENLINLEFVDPGIYLVNYENDQGFWQIGKILKIR